MDPVLGIMERSKLLRAKQERIVALETENSILHLQLAQLRGSLKQVLVTEVECTRCEVYKTKMSSFEEEVKLLHNSLRELREQLLSYTSQLQNSLRTLQAIVPALLRKNTSRTTEYNELQAKYLREKTRRKELHNALVDLRGNIRVHCRVRPVLDFDQDPQSGHKAMECIKNIDEPRPQPFHRDVNKARDEATVIRAFFCPQETICVRQVRSSVSGPAVSEKLYEFDRAYGPTHRQEDVFSEVQPLITSLLDGYNVCIMAYGQTGSGKTYTMLGEGGGLVPSQHHGVVPMATKELFRLMKEKEESEESHYKVRVSISEIYNEQIRDLLHSDKQAAKHEIITNASGGMDIATLTTRSVNTCDDVMVLVQQGMRERSSDSTQVHQHSSRSHLIITIHVTGESANGGDVTSNLTTPTSSRDSTPMASPSASPLRPRRKPPLLPSSSVSAPSLFMEDLPRRKRRFTFQTKLQLVDLAGSECVGMTGVTGKALREAQYINKSLSSLSDVLGALAEKRQHVPYRNSTLTYLLQDSIGGDAKFAMFVCISPTLQYLCESNRVLGFGTRAQQVQRGPAKKQRTSRTLQ